MMKLKKEIKRKSKNQTRHEFNFKGKDIVICGVGGSTRYRHSVLNNINSNQVIIGMSHFIFMMLRAIIIIPSFVRKQI